MLPLLLSLAAGTLVSEDLTCAGAGFMVATGRAGFLEAALGCFLGIVAGDLLLHLAGRHLGRRFLARAPLRWILAEQDVARGAEWFARRGGATILLSRPIPGTRLPTYFAAGLFGMPVASFALWCAAGAALWTPALVAASAAAGGTARGATGHGGTAAIAAALALVMAVRGAAWLSSWSNRRRALGALRRLARWEFWPPWLFYPPVVAYVLALGLRHRSPSLFTAANPAIDSSGFVGESKIGILRGLATGGAPVARFRLLPAGLEAVDRAALLAEFMAREDLSFPVVLKPDVGQRGSRVAIARDVGEAARYLESAPFDVVAQEHIGGLEYGLFYYRLPEEPRGHLLSITEKTMPEVEGDGVRTIEELILGDRRAACMARVYLDRLRPRLGEIPRAGERVVLAELGTHCLGSIFLDGERLRTGELEDAVDRASAGYEGFHFGRYDVRATSEADLRAGRFTILELNGVTSESTDIYDPRNSLLDAYRRLFAQWRIAFEIGRRNRDRGARVTGVREIAALALSHLRASG
ncbi:MAG: VTT domain-containing protein [Acidobacteria bacterium]|nr:VTT domain-containing protein [Acidobacteriota bacterium]